jgi:hypothetical protein
MHCSSTVHLEQTSPRLPHESELFPSRQKLPEQQPSQVPHVDGGLQNPSMQRPEHGWQGPVVPQKLESCDASGTQRPKSQQPLHDGHTGESATLSRVSHATTSERMQSHRHHIEPPYLATVRRRLPS